LLDLEKKIKIQKGEKERIDIEENDKDKMGQCFLKKA
jgi:hypothetical protein